MFCTNCNNEDENLKLKSPVCVKCGFDNLHVLELIEEDDDEEVEDVFRTALECAKRCIVLFGLVSAGHGEDGAVIADWLKNEDLWDIVSDEEKKFFETRNPTEQQVINATWRVEALGVLVWSLEKLPSISNFRELCDVNGINSICDFYLKSTKSFIESSVFRSEDEIFDASELIYEAHWKVRDAQIHGRNIPDGIISSLIQERHHAINWLMGYCGQEWDEVTTDT